MKVQSAGNLIQRRIKRIRVSSFRYVWNGSVFLILLQLFYPEEMAGEIFRYVTNWDCERGRGLVRVELILGIV